MRSWRMFFRWTNVCRRQPIGSIINGFTVFHCEGAEATLTLSAIPTRGNRFSAHPLIVVGPYIQPYFANAAVGSEVGRTLNRLKVRNKCPRTRKAHGTVFTLHNPRSSSHIPKPLEISQKHRSVNEISRHMYTLFSFAAFFVLNNRLTRATG